MTFKSQALDVLKAANKAMTYDEIAKLVPGSCGSTIDRALRKLWQEGLVSKEPQNHAKPQHTKLWSFVSTPSTLSSVPTPTPQPKSKVITMCLPANKPTLVTATIQTIELMLFDETKFSAHDVTKRLRELVGSGIAKVDEIEVGTVHVSGKNVPRIDHEDVKGIVHEYFSTGKMSDWERTMVNDHWVYQPPTVQQPVPPPIVVLVPAADYDGDPLL